MHLPANTFSARHESRGEVTGSSTGTTLTASGTTNTKGSYASLGSATSFAYEGITIYVCNNNNPADYMIDIAIGSAGNEFVIVPDLHFAAFKEANEHNLAIFVPVHIPAGAQIRARVAASSASVTCRVVVVGHSANPGGFPGYSRAVALFTPSASRGVAVDPGGTSNTKGSWAQLTSSCPVDVEAVFGVVGFNNDVARTGSYTTLFDIGVGSAGNEFVVLPNFYFGWAASWDGPNDVFFQPIGLKIPQGNRVAARAQNQGTGAGDRTFDLSLYALVP